MKESARIYECSNYCGMEMLRQKNINRQKLVLGRG